MFGNICTYFSSISSVHGTKIALLSIGKKLLFCFCEIFRISWDNISCFFLLLIQIVQPFSIELRKYLAYDFEHFVHRAMKIPFSLLFHLTTTLSYFSWNFSFAQVKFHFETQFFQVETLLRWENGWVKIRINAIQEWSSIDSWNLKQLTNL